MQKNEIQIYSINPDYKLRQVIFDCFKSICHELPIKGGWGANKEDAIIIDKNDPVVPIGLPFNGVKLEYLIVEKLIYLDLIIVRPKEDRYSGIKWKLTIQKLIRDGGRSYDHLNFIVSAHTDNDFETLKSEFEQGIKDEKFNHETHQIKHNQMLKSYPKDIWFDLTSFHK